ncbi:hypothetical protein [Corallococcus sp. AS-1-12]|uniref:hypothetical protein n=1 Tax=Corallococcus sp. AS-1-12 TaxID=2874598 RepID=UPI001CBC626E|nr:hypothetical protein [Corallococcus sp. AS-1-12]MBZ4332975.1 hypothetical protein [Corallococcus sp. AS-1-12]
MPVTSRSRYFNQPVNRVLDSSGEEHEAIAIRPAPPPAPSGESQHLMSGLESIEYLAWRYFGTSDSWWRIADANPLKFPLDLFPGSKVTIPSSADVGRMQRTRKV